MKKGEKGTQTPLSASIRVLVTVDQKAQLQAAANRLCNGYLSQYIRDAVLEALAKENV